jgi:hypothetical protein
MDVSALDLYTTRHRHDKARKSLPVSQMSRCHLSTSQRAEMDHTILDLFGADHHTMGPLG